ncbi:YdbL family protein [Croceibacterium sp. TMG7-5b_MA50]|uniref:YdbL family protein n=1 Tax=Croceibacterium sp. TMG7-5b_MA50 TaxID=3121290 RepID=UPI0032219CD2
MTTIRSLAIALPALVALAFAAPAAAQRDPAYEAARAAGTVGERTDGYLAVIGGGDAALRKMVDDINIRRRAIFARRAQAEGATMEEYSFTAGCLTIARTQPGEKYQAPDGSWQTRGNGAPVRDSRCPG